MGKASKPKPAASFFGGLTFKEFRRLGKIPLEMNDISWAGRLYTVSLYWFNRLTWILYIMTALCILSLVAIAVAVKLRPPALLIGVYPDGQTLCFPRLLDAQGHPRILHKDYQDICTSLATRAGKRWDVEAFDSPPETSAIVAPPGSIKPSEIPSEEPAAVSPPVVDGAPVSTDPVATPTAIPVTAPTIEPAPITTPPVGGAP